MIFSIHEQSISNVHATLSLWNIELLFGAVDRSLHPTNPNGSSINAIFELSS
jgi:uncharacterized protein (UPF0210 family)